MDYPNNFDTPAFPAGNRIAQSRAVAIMTYIAFAAIIFMCIMLGWSARSMRIHPFLISIDNITGRWQIVGHDHGNTRQMSAWRTLQESVIVKYAANWFAISAIDSENIARWAPCNTSVACKQDLAYGDPTCVMACMSSNVVTDYFQSDVVPQYQLRAQMGETWELDINSVQITNISPVSPTGGIWQFHANVISNDRGPISIIAYARVARDAERYPRTMGFYINGFNAYRIN